MGKYLELYRCMKKTSLSTASGDEINEISRKSRVDLYLERARAALQQIARPDYPSGLIPWLRVAHPNLYQELTSILPDEIHRMWTARHPIPEFEKILELWLIAHRTACEIYRKAHVLETTGSAEGMSKGKEDSARHE